jgi:DNA replication protein DnaC
MNPIPELAPQLKQLRLSGILDSLDARNRQALDGKLAYTEFLSLLIQDEVARREHKKLQMRLRRATFRATKTLEQFDFERLPKLNRALVHELATGRYLAERAPVLIVGPCGTGKSHLGQALGHCAIRQGVDVLFSTCAQLTASLNAARATGSYERKLMTLARVPLLIIDLCAADRYVESDADTAAIPETSASPSPHKYACHSRRSQLTTSNCASATRPARGAASTSGNTCARACRFKSRSALA